MAGLRILREDVDGTVTFRLEGTFNGETAKQLRKLLEELGTSEVVIDFSHVREFLDLALPAIICALQAKKVQLLGLARHQERMFRYFGIPIAHIENQAYRAEETMLN